MLDETKSASYIYSTLASGCNLSLFYSKLQQKIQKTGLSVYKQEHKGKVNISVQASNFYKLETNILKHTCMKQKLYILSPITSTKTFFNGQ